MRLLLFTPPFVPIEESAMPFDEDGFVDWLTEAAPGEWVIYYRGHLGFDRMPSANVISHKKREALNAVANRVMVAADQGLVHPVQKRVGPGDFLYISVKAGLGQKEQRCSAELNFTPTPPVAAESPAAPITLAA